MLERFVAEVKGWRDRPYPEPELLIDRVLHVLEVCASRGFRPTEVGLTNAETAVIIFRSGEAYADLEVDYSGKILVAMPPRFGVRGDPVVLEVSHARTALARVLDQIANRLGLVPAPAEKE